MVACSPDSLSIQRGESWNPVHPQRDYLRPLPAACGGELPWQYASNQTTRHAPQGVVELRQAGYWGGYGGMLLNADKHLLLDLSRDIWPPEAHTGRLRAWQDGPLLRGTTAVLTTPEARGNFWHWTTELLPRIQLIDTICGGLHSVDHFLVNERPGGYRSAMLRAFGVPEDRILWVDQAFEAVLEHAWVPTLRERHWDVPDWAFQSLEKHLPKGGQGPRRLYLSRAGCRFRRLLDEEPLARLLRERGFEVFKPEEHPIADQVAAFRHAEAVVGVHGAAFTLSFLCRPGTPVIEIQPPEYTDLSFWSTCHYARAAHGILVGLGSRPAPGIHPRARFADVRLSREMLASALDQAGL